MQENICYIISRLYIFQIHVLLIARSKKKTTFNKYGCSGVKYSVKNDKKLSLYT